MLVLLIKVSWFCFVGPQLIAGKMKMHFFCFECTCVCRVSAAVSAALRSDENISKMPSSQK